MLKTLGIVLAALLGLLLLAALFVRFFFDPNDYKDEIAAAVETRTGRALAIDGDLSLELFPWLAIGIGQATLSNAPGFGEQPFASIESASLSIRLWPLLQRRIEIGTVALDGLELNLAVDESGRSNWEDLAEPEAPPEPATEEEGGIASLSVGAVEVSDARIGYVDASTGERYVLEGFDLETGALEPGEPFALSMDFQVQSEAPDIDAGVSLESEVTVAFEAGRFLLEDAAIGLRLSGDAVPGEDEMQVQLSADAISLDTEAQTLELDALVAELAGLELRAQASGREILDAPRLTGTVEVPRFAPREALRALDIPVETSDPAALESASLAARVAFGENGFTLEDLSATLDQTRMRGSVRVPSGEAAPIRFELTVDAIDLDRYLPPGSEPGAEEGVASALDELEIPVETLRGLQLDGSLRIGEIVVSEMRLQDVTLGLSSDGETARLHPLDAQFYGGRYAGDIRLDVASTPPRLSLDEHVQGIQIGPLMRDMYELERISGRFDGDLVLAATGTSLGAMRRTLGGDVNLVLAGGAIEGMDLWGAIRRARALLPGQPEAPDRSGPERTEITELRATGTVTDGTLRNDDLIARLPFLNVTGEGRINLPESTVDYDLLATVVEKPELSAQSNTDALTGKTIPVSVTGTFGDLKVRPDIGAALKERARGRLEEEIRERIGGGDEARTDADESEDDLEETLKKKALEEFEDLFGD